MVQFTSIHSYSLPATTQAVNACAFTGAVYLSCISCTFSLYNVPQRFEMQPFRCLFFIYIGYEFLSESFDAHSGYLFQTLNIELTNHKYFWNGLERRLFANTEINNSSRWNHLRHPQQLPGPLEFPMNPKPPYSGPLLHIFSRWLQSIKDLKKALLKTKALNIFFLSFYI